MIGSWRNLKDRAVPLLCYDGFLSRERSDSLLCPQLTPHHTPTERDLVPLLLSLSPFVPILRYWAAILTFTSFFSGSLNRSCSVDILFSKVGLVYVLVNPLHRAGLLLLFICDISFIREPRTKETTDKIHSEGYHQEIFSHWR